MKARAASPQSSTLQQDCRARCLSTHTFFACMRSCVRVCVYYYGMVWPFCFYGNGNLTHSASLINYATFFFADGAAFVFAHARARAHAQHNIIVDLTNTRHVFSDSVSMQQRRRQREPEPRSVYFSGITKDVAGENNKRRERKKNE